MGSRHFGASISCEHGAGLKVKVSDVFASLTYASAVPLPLADISEFTSF